MKKFSLLLAALLLGASGLLGPAVQAGPVFSLSVAEKVEGSVYG